MGGSSLCLELDAAVFLTENKKGLIALMERETPPARASAAFKSMTKWLSGFDVISQFLEANKKPLIKLVDRESAGVVRSSLQFKGATNWLGYFGKKWYFAYLF